MSNKVQRFIASERELSQLKHWLKTTYRISIEEFVIPVSYTHLTLPTICSV